MSNTLPDFRILNYHNDMGQSSCVVVPGWGANVIAFSHHDARLKWPTPVLEAVDIATIASKPTSYGMPILGPTPGRVGLNQSGKFNYKGTDYQLDPTRHGVLRDRIWKIDKCTKTQILCSTEVKPDDAQPGYYPFPFRAEHELTIGDRRLESRIQLRNLADHPIPLDIGWHPYLARTGPCTVTIPAESYWELDGDLEPTPTGDRLPAMNKYDLRTGSKLLEQDHFDDIFTDLPQGDVCNNVKEVTNVVLKDGALEEVEVNRSVVLPAATDKTRAVRHVQLYTPPGRNAICIEPLSAPPNAVNKDLGFHEVEANGVVEFRLILKIRIGL